MYLTLGFKNKNLLMLETSKGNSLEECIDELKELYLDFCSEHDFCSEEINFIEQISYNDHVLLDHEELQNEWDAILKDNRLNYKSDKAEQRATRSNYLANLL